MRSLWRLGALLCVLGLAATAPAAWAGVSKWTSLPGLTAATKATWVRVYTPGTASTTLYAGTEGSGVFKSVDGGLTWKPFSTGLPSGDKAIRAIVVVAGKVYAGTDAGLFSTADTNSSSGSWKPLAQGPNPDPGHPTKLNASVQAVISPASGALLAGTVSSGVYRSTDSGATWKPPANNSGMPAGTTVWSFASFASSVWAATSNGIYRSANQGSTWSLKNDGIPFDVTLGVFQDTQNPAVYYAETGSTGVYRSTDGATSWKSINGGPKGEPFGGASTPTIHALKEVSGPSQTRLYAATSDGLWAGTLSNQIAPSTPVWRRVTPAGLGTNTIMWALSDFTTTPSPSTLLAGTQSNGGYALSFQPPSNDGQAQNLPTWANAATKPLKVGTVLSALPGVWTGTTKIDYAYQWQRCTSAAGGCANIAGPVSTSYMLTNADKAKFIRVIATASNDAPSFSTPQAISAIRGPVGAAPGPLPGDNQESAPTIRVTPSDDQSLPTEGDVLSAPPSSQDPSGWLFNPAATSVTYKWERCNANGGACVAIPVTAPTDKLTSADDGLTLRVLVTGTNSNGSKTLPVSGPTNQIIPLPAKVVDPPTLAGDPYVGSSLVGAVGTWASPATYWTRQWEQCGADGSDCTPIQGATTSAYTVRAADLGMTLRMHVVADVNSSSQLPLAVDAYTAITQVITNRPSPAP
jgi:hypothetical protein